MNDPIAQFLDRFRSYQPWSVALSLAVGVASISGRLFDLFDQARPISEFRDRGIGITVLEGIDAAGYAHNYVRLHLLFVAVAFSCFLATAWLCRILDRQVDARLTAGPKRAVTILSELSIAVVVLRLITGDEVLEDVAAGIFFLVALIAVLVLLRALPTLRGRAPLISDDAFLAGALFLPLPVFFLHRLVLDRPLSLGPSTAGILARYTVLLAAVLVVAWLSERRRTADGGATPGATPRATPGYRVLRAGVPWILIPLSIPVANELQYGRPDLLPRHLALGLAALLTLAAGALCLLPARPGASLRRLVHRVYFPLFLLTAAVFKLHLHTMRYDQLDYFHKGEITLPTQQLFHFGSMPLIDLRLTHTFSDMVYQALYTWLNGFHGLDMLLWEKWVPGVVAVVLVYFFLARLVSPLFALAVTACLPVTGLVTPYYAPALVPALCLCRAAERPTFRRCLLLWASAFALLLWRVDFGIAGFAALVPVTTVDALRARDGRWKNLLLGLAAAAAGLGLLLAVLALLGHRPALESLGFLLRSYSYRLVTRTRSAVIAHYTILAVFQYYLLPAVSLIYILYFAVRKTIDDGAFAVRKHMLAALAVFSLILSVRSLERHSLIESFNPYLFSFLWAVLPFLFVTGRGAERDPPRRWPARALFLAVLLLHALFVLQPLGKAGGWVEAHHLFRDGELFTFRRWTAGEHRVLFDSRRHGPLVELFDAALRKDQTFFDFTNSPLLYVLADRRFPTYVIGNLNQASETVQGRVIAELEALRSRDRLPLVVFKQGDPFWDNTDSVPNEIRCYRIAEYIYRHYEPALEVGTYHVWKTRGRDLGPVVHEGERFDLATRAEPTHHSLKVTVTDEGTVRLKTTGGPDPNVLGLVELEGLPDLSDGHWRLSLRYRSARPGELQIFFSADGAAFREALSERVGISATPDRAWRELVVPVATDPGARRLTDLRLDPSSGSEIEIGGLALSRHPLSLAPLRPERVVQRFELQRLPRIWAELDPLDALHRTERIADLLPSASRGEGAQEAVVLEPGVPFPLPLPAGLDRAAASYLHLRLRYPHGALAPQHSASEPVRLRIAYGETLESSFGFELEVPEAELRVVPQRLRLPPVTHNLALSAAGPELVLESAGEDPWAHRFLDLGGLPQLAGDRELYLLLEYRSTVSGEMQVFFSFDGRFFDDITATGLDLFAAGPLRQVDTVLVPIPHGHGDRRLTDLRFDPPEGRLEITAIELLYGSFAATDHLVRLSSQWEWTAGEARELRLTASRPVALLEAVLRGAD